LSFTLNEILLSVRVDLSEGAGAHVLTNELHLLAAIHLKALLEARLLVFSPVTSFWLWLSPAGFGPDERRNLSGLCKALKLV
jgi:hypothetical protein